MSRCLAVFVSLSVDFNSQPVRRLEIIQEPVADIDDLRGLNKIRSV